ncbi:PaaI family thioesterase [Zavarzinia compransoris]|uniref:PaaI family thioesterase n=1 Tax=Zavarzinia marina TaxID=2911065 RepID=UPI001F355124|nr:PaaI family thioesterase [Zavarzinia marina]MCF4166000.1 PaaI family thioesterase [Zavarzinia marina]
MDAVDVAARFGAQALPACSAHLGFSLVRFDAAARELEATFEGKPEFCNPRGVVQGGFQAAMLDDVMAVALILSTEGRFVPPTLELKLSYFEPVMPGTVRAKGRVLRLGRSITFLEGDLLGPDDSLLVRASATAKLLRIG